MRSESASWILRGAGLTIGVGLVLVLAAIAAAAREVLLLVFLAVLLGAALEPIVAAIRGRTGLGRGLAILLVYAAFLLLVVGSAVLILPTAMSQLGVAFGHLPAFLDQVRSWSGQLRPQLVADGIAALVDAAEAPFKSTAPPDPGSVVSASLVLGQVGAALVTLLVLVFFWLTERPRLQRYALAFFPAGRRAGIRDAWNEIENRLGYWARGQLILMAAIGVATGTAYSLIGLPAALLLAVIAALTEIIPILGPFLGAVPALLVATTISPETLLITAGVYVLLQAVEGNILVPIVMRNSVGLSPFLVLVSLLVGGTAGGVLGAIVAVPLMASVTVVLDRLQDRRHPVPIDPTMDHGTDADREELEEVPPAAPPRRRRSHASSAG